MRWFALEHDMPPTTASVTLVIGPPFAERVTYPSSTPEWNTIVSQVELGFTHDCPHSETGRVLYRLAFKTSSGTASCRFNEWDVQGTPYQLIPDAIRHYAGLRTQTRIPWDPRLHRNQSGTLFVESTPIAWMEIDGISLDRKTPVNNLHLATGQHIIRLYRQDRNRWWTFPVTIHQGQATNLNVELK